MDFDLSDEQRLLRESLSKLLADRYDFEQRKAYTQTADGWSRELWSAYGELGLLGLPFDERYGGFGGGPVDIMLVMEEFGRALVVEPFFTTVVLGGALVRLAASEAQKGQVLPKVAEGKLKLAFAHTERQSRYDLADVTTTAKRDGSGWILDGSKSVVLHGDSADKLIVSARTGGSQRDRQGIGLFLVDANARGVACRGYPTQDAMRAAEITLTKVPAEGVLGDPGGALPIIERAVDEAMAALCAEAVGAMTALQELTVEYLKTRKQFGVAIGSFQALQHRAADMLVALEQARSMALFATMMAAEENESERRKAIAAAKVQIGRSAKFVGQQAIQLHGGIGMTMEYKGGHYFKRLTMIDTLFGTADHHLAELARLGGLIDAA